jgi:hypothetical protein
MATDALTEIERLHAGAQATIEKLAPCCGQSGQRNAASTSGAVLRPADQSTASTSVVAPDGDKQK